MNRKRIAEIDRILDRTSTWEAPVYRVDRAKLNREKKRLMRGDRPKRVDDILTLLDRSDAHAYAEKKERVRVEVDPNIPEGKCGCGCGGWTRISERSNKKRGWKKGKPRRFLMGHNQKLKEKHQTND